ncbi:MAG: 50S ribosomal protein L7/L12 [Planctomycetes bacterium]|jgi:large subunit ribosomal protein L7/L12|nr:50S ribosomal protein L7/L12 [Planctomycetota bacterium]
MSETAVYPGKVGEVVEQLKTMTALELSALKKAIEETFGVTAAAPMAVMAGGGGAAVAATEEAPVKDTFAVKLTGVGEQKIQVIKVVRSLLGLGLKEAKDFVDKAAASPQVMKEAASKDEAEKMKKEVEEAGGKVELA